MSVARDFNQSTSKSLFGKPIFLLLLTTILTTIVILSGWFGFQCYQTNNYISKIMPLYRTRL